jgi:CubicO group peptidase (beta-lactamase class C family)
VRSSLSSASRSNSAGFRLRRLFRYANPGYPAHQEPHHDLKVIVIVRNGRLASEHYFNGDSVDSLHDIPSATKSITTLLIGITINQGLVHSVNDSIAPYLPGMAKDGKEKITIKVCKLAHHHYTAKKRIGSFPEASLFAIL